MTHNCVFKSSLSLKNAKSLSTGHQATFTNTNLSQAFYIFLKGQITVIESIMEKIQKSLKDTNREYLLTVQKYASELVSCNYSTLSQNIEKTISGLQELLKIKNPPEDEKIAQQLLMTTVSLSQLINLSFRNYTTQFLGKKNNMNEKDINAINNPVENTDSDVNNQLSPDDIVVCRICDEKVPIDLIDEHTQLCYKAYNSVSFITETNEKLRNMKAEISNKYLNHSWPGSMNMALSTLLPVLATTNLVDQVLAIRVNEIDSIEEMISYSSIFEFYSNSSSDLSHDILRFKPLIEKKIKACKAYKVHSEGLKQINGDVHQLAKQPNISDFDFLKRISSGAYARVFLAKKKKTGDIYAIKVIPKSSLTLKNQVKRILAEKDILLQFSNPYIVSFYYSIIGDHNLYLVMEYLPGGDLYSLLQHLGSLDEETARVYTFQIVNALKYLRENGIIHRDLKPDNILIAKNGNLKLTDFGLSFLGMVNRQVSNESSELIQSNSYVGTPDYIAPEMLLNRPHSFAVDLWSLGVTIYEFLMGEPPFHGETEKVTHENILRGRFALDDDLSSEAVDLIVKLLNTNPDERIGAKDIDEILKHPWLDGVDPSRVPFKPELNSKEDTNYFECRYKFNAEDDKDILEDISTAHEQSKDRNRSPNISISSSGGATGPRSYNDIIDDDTQLEVKFESVSVKSLAEANLAMADKVRRKRSVSFTSNEEPENHRRSVSETGTKKFISLMANTVNIPKKMVPMQSSQPSLPKVSLEASSDSPDFPVSEPAPDQVPVPSKDSC
ncbi:AGC family protein kinase [Tritrichomonas foetus]|uniref:non-specific serine/threonine protein kinase n=1 Tax=Tritrichomonas foetus TaxID=1144522 RepID=A0A1J4JT91_9EUKA|nr:AGC family protein kinase [Tritrichomonas foetus]|eukprot:OHT01648.1 AGC family protein kinase [Tritrichomonas foetus]